MTDHACLACGEVHPGAREVTLHGGAVVSSFSEAWRHESEAISILALPSKNERYSILHGIEKHRGKPAADALRTLVWKLWDIQVAQQRQAG